MARVHTNTAYISQDRHDGIIVKHDDGHIAIRREVDGSIEVIISHEIDEDTGQPVALWQQEHDDNPYIWKLRIVPKSIL